MIHKTAQGVDVPALGFGTYQLTGRTCRRGVADALALGYRHIDTAQAYDNEAQVGRGLRDGGVDRSDVFLTTKVWTDKLAPRGVRSSTETSLSQLKSDYVDLLLIHWPVEGMDLEGVLDAMLELQDEEKVRQIGVSNFTPDLMRRAANHASILTNQIEYHPYLDQHELLEVAHSVGALVTAYAPIARGRVLSDETLQSIAAQHAKTPAQVTLRWLLQQDHVVAIPKASDSSHRRENIDIFNFELSPDEMDAISALACDDRIVSPAWAPTW